MSDQEKPGRGIIYGMCDPRTNELRYVGKTINSLAYRIRRHMTPGVLNRYDTHHTRWLRQLRELGLYPKGIIIMELPLYLLDEAEIFWIAYMRRLGANLTNTAEGGTGGVTRKGRPNTPEHNRKLHEGLRRAHLNGLIAPVKWSDAAKRAHSEARKGMKFTDEHRANIAAAKKGKKQSPEAVEKRTEALREALKVRGYSPGIGKKISESKKGKYTEAMQKSLELAHASRRGVPITNEHKEKQRQAIGKLNWEKVDEIRILLKEGKMRKVDIAKLYGVSPRVILSIQKEETWKPEYHPSKQSQ